MKKSLTRVSPKAGSRLGRVSWRYKYLYKKECSTGLGSNHIVRASSSKRFHGSSVMGNNEVEVNLKSSVERR